MHKDERKEHVRNIKFGVRSKTGVRLNAKAVNFLLKTWAPELIYEALEAMDLDHPNPVGFIMTYGANHTKERNPKFKLDTSKMLKR